VPNYVIPDRVIVGGVLPEAGITYYDVPQTYGPTPYQRERHTAMSGRHAARATGHESPPGSPAGRGFCFL
jgi:hypothetical protein